MTKRVAVIGVGSIGSMTLWQLAKKGIEAVGFEQFGIAHDRSAAGGESRMFRTAYMEGAEYVPLLKESRVLWGDLEAETGYNLLTLNGGLMIGPKDSYKMKNVIKSTHDFDISHEVLDAASANVRFPQHKLNPDDIMVLDKEAGFMRPELAVFAAAERAEALGAVIHRHAAVEQIEELEGKVRVVANGVPYDFDQVIVTAGPWTTKLFPELKENLTPRKIVMTWYPTDKMNQYVPNAFPVFGRWAEEISFFGIPTLEGTMVKIGSIDTFGDVEDPDNLHRDVALSELNNINQAVRNYMPDLRPDPVRISVHMDGYTTDEHAVVGLVPGFKRTFIMGGYSGHGFKLAPVMGKIGLDLIETGNTNFNISHLRPERFLKVKM
ncbi:N-methyl-L-tryptophan oxidase [Bacillus sp. ISL-40]|uniref:N-methyl-L-tryptophan oxidase n=1 Tax=unclassified Bacillus (in: firmicutes) TaxID=185979 RepID=UPI001BE66ABF|nr:MULTISPECIES: N-methyl-L-tryptophan oxidase [unclassified Bacillus (in: firmicutes)]MBT2698596.1 N-methyl-L-tryptophan oxidase [Bacillus sp. ISL-40]MBT2720229.1 N-methyl-L-tryptophan oxidase [Bacillus sp. ISL-46]MBT2739178.1 N-methyl-L-tryptophan oxidase [Bacillus sp. ISL-77]